MVSPDWSKLFRFAHLILWNYKTVLLKDEGEKKQELSVLKNVKSQMIFKHSDKHLRLWHREYPQSSAV